MKHLLLILLIGGGSSNAYAEGSHHTAEQTIIIQNTTERVVEKVSQNGSGIALSIAAAQHSFDWGSYDLQGSVAVGGYENSNAISIGAAKRFNRTLINGSFGIEDGKAGYGAALNFRF